MVLRSPSAQTSVDLERSFDGARGRDARKKGEKRGEESQRREKIEEAEEKREESHDKVRNRAWSSGLHPPPTSQTFWASVSTPEKGN